MTVNIPEPLLLDTHRSTWVDLDAYGEVQKLATFPRFSTAWRGFEVIVTMSCDRYRHSSGMSEWRVYASEARGLKRDENGAIEPYGYGAQLTDTARSRLSDACKPLALAWIDSDAGREEFRVALVYAIKRELTDSRGDTARVRGMVGKHSARIGNLAVAQLLFACGLRDEYDVALEGIGRDE